MGEKKKQPTGAAEDPKTLEKINAELKAEIQEMVRAQKGLIESEDRYLATFETILEGYFETDLRGNRSLNGRRIHDDPLHH